jgi:hypothetical protein
LAIFASSFEQIRWLQSPPNNATGNWQFLEITGRDRVSGNSLHWHRARIQYGIPVWLPGVDADLRRELSGLRPEEAAVLAFLRTRLAERAPAMPAAEDVTSATLAGPSDEAIAF